MMDIHAILKQLPHRYPFLLVDRVLVILPFDGDPVLREQIDVQVRAGSVTAHIGRRPKMAAERQ